jgi:hypothetical protein
MVGMLSQSSPSPASGVHSSEISIRHASVGAVGARVGGEGDSLEEVLNKPLGGSLGRELGLELGFELGAFVGADEELGISLGSASVEIGTSVELGISLGKSLGKVVIVGDADGETVGKVGGKGFPAMNSCKS